MVSLHALYGYLSSDALTNYLSIDRLVLEPWMLPDGLSYESPRVTKLLLNFGHQNGPKWVVSYALPIAQRACPQNCASFVFSILSLSDNVFLKSAFVQAYPDTADAKFKKHW